MPSRSALAVLMVVLWTLLALMAWGQDKPKTQTEPLKVKVYLCAPDQDTPQCAAKLAQWKRKKDIEALVPLLIEDFGNTTTIDKALRDREAAIMKRLSDNQHKYD